jgi:hypothetical protein
MNNGEKVVQLLCNNGFSVNTAKASEFTCKDGVFLRTNGATNVVCRKECLLSALVALDPNSQEWIEESSANVKFDGTNIIAANPTPTGSAAYGSYFTINSCTAQTKHITRSSTHSIVVTCGDGGNWSIIKNENSLCHDNCNISAYTTNKHISGWEYFDAASGTYKNLTTNTIANGVKIRPLGCVIGYTINGTTDSKQVMCLNTQLKEEYLGSLATCSGNCTFNITNARVGTWSATHNSSITHGTKVYVQTCSTNYTLQAEGSMKEVYKCNDGTLSPVSQNPIASICKSNCTFNITNARVGTWSVTQNSSITHGTSVKVQTCSANYTLQSGGGEKEVYKCNDGTLSPVSQNPIASICT